MLRFPTQDHKDITIHLLKRVLELHNSLKAREERRLDRRYLTAKNTLAKISGKGLDFKLLRPELRCIQGQAESVRDTLNNTTIPTYLNRIDNVQTDASITEVERQQQIEQYQRYVTANKLRAKLCDEVSKAAEGAL